MKNFKKILTFLLAVCMIVSVFALSSCGNSNDDNNDNDKTNSGNNNTSNKTTYTVTIVDGDNNPVKDAKVIFTDGSTFTQPVATDANGKASTKLAEGTISVMISTI